MGLNAVTRTLDGALVAPERDEDWADWVSASATRNYVLHDPLLDWLSLYGAASGFLRDDRRPGYDPRTDFTQLLFRQGHLFEAAVVRLLASANSLVTIGGGRDDVRSLAKAEETYRAMHEGAPIIYQPVLWDAESRTYGAPDLLVRSDVLQRLFPDALALEDMAVGAPDLAPLLWHYRVVDTKFATLRLRANGELDNAASHLAYKAQVYVYNRALGRLQGYLPPAAYLLGRSWEQRAMGAVFRGTGCLERLGPVLQASSVKRETLEALVEGACAWLRRVRREGSAWAVLPRPTLPELWPNTGHREDSPWHHAKRQIAEDIGDLTLLWGVGLSGRDRAHKLGITSWRDPNCAPLPLGLPAGKRASTLQAVLDVNRATDGPAILPARVGAAEDEWRPVPRVEFYVDFETAGDLVDDFTCMPEKGGQPLIFMIGCGHVEDGQWQFTCFVADRLAAADEAGLIDAWLAHMEAMRRRLDPDGPAPPVFHWSHAERSSLAEAYNSAAVRHPDRQWRPPRWFDLYRRVVTEQPVVVRGAMDFGLKSVARAMHQHGLIETSWGEGVSEGLTAMAAAIWCDQQATQDGGRLRDYDLMHDVIGYNEVDCRVMMEIVRYLRERA